jgi:chemotaxis protein methyltransferase CheR
MSSVTATEVEYVRQLVHRRAGLVVEAGKDYLVESRLAPIARSEGLADVATLIARVRFAADGPLHEKIIDAMTTNETSWFRDSHPFEALRTTLLPALIERRRAQRRLTIWSAACSTGQEPYSLAMLILDSFPELASWKIEILASDISHEAVARARAGRYSQLEVQRGLQAPTLAEHFTRDGSDWVVSDRVRTMVRFGAVNLVGSWDQVPVADIVVLRNVMIYFDHETKRQILGRVHQQLRPDGYLFLGNAETTLNVDDGFVRVDPPRAGCYQRRTTPSASTQPTPALRVAEARPPVTIPFATHQGRTA